MTVSFYLPIIVVSLNYLQSSPCIRFNKEGMLLAVTTNNKGIKILANPDGVRLLRSMENRSFDASRVASSSAEKVKMFLDRLVHKFNPLNWF